MYFYKVLASLLVCLLLVNVRVYGETTEDILELYGQDAYDNSELEEEYYSVAKSIARTTMLNTANEILSSELESIVINKSNRLNELYSDLEKVKKETEQNACSDVETLLNLEQQYLSIIKEIEELQVEDESIIITSYDYKYNNNDLDAIEKKMYPEVGDLYIKLPVGCESYITSLFGERINPITGVGLQFHRGLDMHAPEGTNVLATYNGIVQSTGYHHSYGYYVIVNHKKGVKTLYAHLSEILVNQGEEVQQYDILGKAGNTGESTAPHLHLGLYIYGEAVDPLKIIKKEEE